MTANTCFCNNHSVDFGHSREPERGDFEIGSALPPRVDHLHEEKNLTTGLGVCPLGIDTVATVSRQKNKNNKLDAKI